MFSITKYFPLKFIMSNKELNFSLSFFVFLFFSLFFLGQRLYLKEKKKGKKQKSNKAITEYNSQLNKKQYFRAQTQWVDLQGSLKTKTRVH